MALAASASASQQDQLHCLPNSINTMDPATDTIKLRLNIQQCIQSESNMMSLLRKIYVFVE